MCWSIDNRRRRGIGRGDGAESFVDMLRRAAALERRLCETAAERILVFTHADFYAGLFVALVGGGGGRP